MLGELILLKRRALRRNVWYKALSRIERSIYDLTIRGISTIRSGKLLNVIRVIVDKLRKALESPVHVLTRTVGRELAQQIAQVACSWGYLEASTWAMDERFARFLAICYINVPEYYKTKIGAHDLSIQP